MIGTASAGRVGLARNVFGPLLLTLTSLLLVPSDSAAQEKSNPTGFHLGARLNGSSIKFEGDNTKESGGGGGLAIGYGINRKVTLYAEGVGASVEMADFNESYTLAHFDLGVRLNFGGVARSTLGFVNLALTGRAAAIDLLGSPFSISGAGLTVGGGVAFFLDPSTSIDLGLKWTGGTFTEAEYRGVTETIDVSATSARFDIGLSWWAGR